VITLGVSSSLGPCTLRLAACAISANPSFVKSCCPDVYSWDLSASGIVSLTLSLLGLPCCWPALDSKSTSCAYIILLLSWASGKSLTTSLLRTPRDYSFSRFSTASFLFACAVNWHVDILRQQEASWPIHGTDSTMDSEDFTGPVLIISLRGRFAQCSSEKRIIVGETLISQFTYPELGIEPCKDSCPKIGTDDATQA